MGMQRTALQGCISPGFLGNVLRAGEPRCKSKLHRPQARTAATVAGLPPLWKSRHYLRYCPESPICRWDAWDKSSLNCSSLRHSLHQLKEGILRHKTAVGQRFNESNNTDGSRHLACTASCADAAPDTRTRTILGATVDRTDSRAGAAAPEGVAGQPSSHNSGGNRPAGVHFRPDRHQNSNKENSAPKRVFQWNTPCSSPSTGQISGRGTFFNPQHKLKSFTLANSRTTHYWFALNAPNREGGPRIGMQ